jgi:hypothetical protein
VLTMKTIWNVQFVEDYAVTTTTVEAESDDEAIDQAVEMMLDHYGRDFSDCRVEAEPAYGSTAGLDSELDLDDEDLFS